MRMFRKIGLLLPLGLLVFAGGAVRRSAQQQDSVSVIPKPAHVSRGKGTLNLHHGLGFDTSVADADAVAVARYLQELLATTGNRGLIKFSSKTDQGGFATAVCAPRCSCARGQWRRRELLTGDWS
jgi:hypothetical protein